MYVTSISIYQNFGQGAILRIEASDSATGEWNIIWGDLTARSQEMDYVFQPSVCRSLFLTRKIRILIDTSRVDGRNEIDAVLLTGATDKKSFLFPLVEDRSMNLLYVIQFGEDAASVEDEVLFHVKVPIYVPQAIITRRLCASTLYQRAQIDFCVGAEVMLCFTILSLYR